MTKSNSIHFGHVMTGTAALQVFPAQNATRFAQSGPETVRGKSVDASE